MHTSTRTLPCRGVEACVPQCSQRLSRVGLAYSCLNTQENTLLAAPTLQNPWEDWGQTKESITYPLENYLPVSLTFFTPDHAVFTNLNHSLLGDGWPGNSWKMHGTT